MSKPPVGRDTRLCMSLSGRPGNAGSRLHNYLYEAMGLDYVYKSFTTSDLPAAIGGIRALGIRGCAISMPFKEAVIPLIDVLEPSAAVIESVNTILNDDGYLTGYNTDYSAVRTMLRTSPADPAKPFLLRGSGGMAKAVAAALRYAGFTQGTIVARNPVSGPALAAQYGFQWLPQLPEQGAPLLVNVTPLGMEGADAKAMAYPQAMVEAADMVIDVVAQPALTPLIRAALAAGKPVITGAEVVVLQAVEQFTLYTGVEPDRALVIEAARFAHGDMTADRLAAAL
jgi:shikimate dehydrogenase